MGHENDIIVQGLFADIDLFQLLQLLKMHFNFLVMNLIFYFYT